MTDFAHDRFAQARKNMIDCQVATMGVIDPVLLKIMGAMPRERFVPADRQAMAYIDEDLPLGNGSFLMEPLVFARMAQAAAPRPADKVLVLGDATGYAAAVLAHLVNKVVIAETVPGQMDAVKDLWSELGCGNIYAEPGCAAHGCPQEAPFTLVFVNGSVSAIPPALLEQMGEHGRLITVLRKPGQQDGRAVLVTRLANGTHSSKILFDAATPFIEDMAPRRAFVF